MLGWGVVALQRGEYQVAQGRLARARELRRRQAGAAALVLGRDASRAPASTTPRARSRRREEGAAAHPGNAVLRNNLAVLRELAGDVAGAETMLRAALAEDPSLPQISKNLADILYRNGRFDDAKEAYERAAKLAPDLGDDLYFKLGNIAYKRRDHASGSGELAACDRAQPGPRAGADQPRDAGHRPVTPDRRPGFAALTRKISQGSGFTLEAYKDKCIRRRIAVRMRACGVHTYADYQALLDTSPGGVRAAARRAHHQRHPVLPERGDLEPAAPRPDSAALRAGRGRDPGVECRLLLRRGGLYHRHPRRRAPRPRRPTPGELSRLVVDATDVDRLSLDRAKAARYRPENLTEMPPELASRYLEPAGDELQVDRRGCAAACSCAGWT